MIKIRVLLVVCLASLVGVSGCASILGPSEQARREATARILQVYALPAMLKRVAPVITHSLEMNLPSSTSDTQRTRLARAVAETYEATALLAAINQRLRQKAVAEDRIGALLNAADKLDSTLVKDMIALERKAGTEAFNRGYRKFLQQPLSGDDKDRLATTRELLDSMGLVDLQLAFNVGMLKGMIAARNVVVDESMKTSPDTARKMAARTRSGLRATLRQELPVMLLYAYRTVPDAKLARYLALHNSPALAWVNEAIPEVLAAVLQDAAQRLAETYAALQVANEQTSDA